MGTRKGRPLAVVSVLAVIVIAGALVWLSRDHIRFFLAFESLGPNAQGYAEYRHRQTGIVFVSLPGGTFMMGSPEDEEGHEPEEGPMHEVTLSPFMIAKHEVTQEQWEAVMGSDPSEFEGDDLPVESVSWDDCRDFCQRTRLNLPTEAQWEYACRAGATGPFSGTGNPDEMAWHAINSGRRTHPVGEQRPNDFGLYDTHGNVWEWCEDVWDEDFYERSEASGRNPLCVSGSGDRVMRGGCWGRPATGCRSADRYGFHPWRRYDYVGFRPAGRLN